jgi:hypothetical protein
MEKEQIIDACWAGGDDGEQYYEQTYGGTEWKYNFIKTKWMIFGGLE